MKRRAKVKRARPRLRIAKLSEFQADPENANRHRARGQEMVERSMRERGFARPAFAARDGTVLGGNLSAMTVAPELGMDEAIVVESDGTRPIIHVRTDLKANSKAARLLALEDNRSGEVSLHWDPEVLGELPADVLEGLWTGAELETLGVALTEERPGDVEPTPDRAAELLKRWKVQPGERWRLGEHLLVCGDSTDEAVVRHLFSGFPGEPKDVVAPAAMVYTDPPYGIDYESEVHGKVTGDNLRQDALVGLLKPALANAVKYALNNAAFYVWHAATTRRDFEWALDAVGLVEKQYIAWVKDAFNLGHADYHWQTEFCFYCEKAGHTAAFYGDRAQSTVWRAAPAGLQRMAVAIASGVKLSDGRGAEIFVRPRAPKGAKVRLLRLRDGDSVYLTQESAGNAWEIARDPRREYVHPTQKPVALAERAIRNSSQAGEIVLDLFHGGGATLVACERLGRKCRAVELEPKWVAAAIERWVEVTGGRPEVVDREPKAATRQRRKSQ